VTEKFLWREVEIIKVVVIYKIMAPISSMLTGDMFVSLF